MQRIIITFFLLFSLDGLSMPRLCNIYFDVRPLYRAIRLIEKQNKQLATKLINTLVRHYDKPSPKYLPSRAKIFTMIRMGQLKKSDIESISRPGWLLLEKAVGIEPGGLYSIFKRGSIEHIFLNSELAKPGIGIGLHKSFKKYFVRYDLDVNPTFEELVELIRNKQLKIRDVPGLSGERLELFHKLIEEYGLDLGVDENGIEQVIGNYPTKEVSLRSQLLNGLQRYFNENGFNTNPSINELHEWVQRKKIKPLLQIDQLGPESDRLLGEIFDSVINQDDVFGVQ